MFLHITRYQSQALSPMEGISDIDEHIFPSLGVKLAVRGIWERNTAVAHVGDVQFLIMTEYKSIETSTLLATSSSISRYNQQTDREES